VTDRPAPALKPGNQPTVTRVLGTLSHISSRIGHRCTLPITARLQLLF
jgi:hypothetical protein